jgi:hypothetical protein
MFRMGDCMFTACISAHLLPFTTSSFILRTPWALTFLSIVVHKVYFSGQIIKPLFNVRNKYPNSQELYLMYTMNSEAEKK